MQIYIVNPANYVQSKQRLSDLKTAFLPNFKPVWSLLERRPVGGTSGHQRGSLQAHSRLLRSPRNASCSAFFGRILAASPCKSHAWDELHSSKTSMNGPRKLDIPALSSQKDTEIEASCLCTFSAESVARSGDSVLSRLSPYSKADRCNWHSGFVLWFIAERYTG